MKKIIEESISSVVLESNENRLEHKLIQILEMLASEQTAEIAVELYFSQFESGAEQDFRDEWVEKNLYPMSRFIERPSPIPRLEALRDIAKILYARQFVIDGNIKDIPYLDILPNLKVITIQNSAETLPEYITRNRNILTLAIEGGSLRELPQDMSKMTSVVKFVCEGCPISEIPASIAQLSNLMYIRFMDCPINKVHPAVTKMPKLGSFNLLDSELSAEEIERLKKSFPENCSVSIR